MHNSGMVTSDEIKATRTALKETQAQFAQRFGVNQATVHRWETEGLPDRGTTQIAVETVLGSIKRGTE